MKRTTAAIIVCALLAVAGACGSSKKDTTATEGTSAPAEKPSETTVSTASTDSSKPSTTSTTAGSTSTTAGGPTSGSPEADFAAQADALSAKFNDEAAAVPQPTSTALAAIGAYFEQALAQYDQQYAEFQALTPPASERAAWAELLQVLDGQRSVIAALVPRLKAGDSSAMAEMLSLTPVDLSSQFDALGMKTCGSAS